MELAKVKQIVEESTDGTGIISFNMISGDKYESPNFILDKIVDEDNTVILKSRGCVAEGSGDKEAVLVIEHIESISYYPNRKSE